MTRTATWMNDPTRGQLSESQAATKRLFDLGIALPALLIASPMILICWISASLSTRSNGLFTQTRVGQHGIPFTLYKLRSMKNSDSSSTVTTATDARVTRVGRFLRRSKLDELPQLFNVIRGDMSLVGPRPDVPGFADALEGDDRRILTLKPGITGPASVHFSDEESLLADQDDPIAYNRNVLWPRKVTLNLEYMDAYRLRDDVRWIWRTVFGERR